MKILDVSLLFTPGIYKIFCVENKKVYIGESRNVFSRLGRHSNDLEKNRHDCFELQNDFNQYGKQAFLFYAFDLGPELAIKLKRKIKEITYIQETDPRFCYNQEKNKKWNFYSQKVFIKGQTYSSLREAASKVCESRTNIMRKIKDLNNCDYPLLETLSYKRIYNKRSIPCNIDNVNYFRSYLL